MRNQIVARKQQQLNTLFKMIGTSATDIELQSNWAKYLCILVAGFLEVSVRELYRQYAMTKADPRVASYVKYKLEGFQNPNMTKILELTRSFSSEWHEQLKQKTVGEIKDAIDSIMANRHKIAHGEDVSISYTRIKDYYNSAIKALELIDSQCN